MKFTITLNDGSKKSLINKNSIKEPFILGKQVIIKRKTIIPPPFILGKQVIIKRKTIIPPTYTPPPPVKKFFIKQSDGSKKMLKHASNIIIKKENDFTSRLGKRVIIKRKQKVDDFTKRLGKQVIIKRNKQEDSKIHFQIVLKVDETTFFCSFLLDSAIDLIVNGSLIR